jgi:hypothetical protein
VLFLHQETNRDWHKLDPRNQVEQIANSLRNDEEISEFYRNSLVSEDALTLLQKTEKTVSDFYEFIDARFEHLCKVLERWEFYVSAVENENA